MVVLLKKTKETKETKEPKKPKKSKKIKKIKEETYLSAGLRSFPYKLLSTMSLLYILKLKYIKEYQNFQKEYNRQYSSKEEKIPRNVYNSLPNDVKKDIDNISNAKSYKDVKTICSKNYLKYHPDKNDPKEKNKFDKIFDLIKKECDRMKKKYPNTI